MIATEFYEFSLGFVSLLTAFSSLSLSLQYSDLNTPRQPGRPNSGDYDHFDA